MIYTTAYTTTHPTFEDLFIVGSLNTAISVCRTAAQERKSISTVKVLQNTPIKKDRFLPLSCFFSRVFNSSWI